MGAWLTSLVLIACCYVSWLVVICRNLGVFPSLTIVHTDKHIEGQLYIPEVSLMLMIGCIAIAVGFRSE